MAPKQRQLRRNGGRRQRGRKQSGAGASLGPQALMLRPSYTTPHKFSRSVDLGILSRAAGDQGYAFSFDLGMLPQVSEFTSLYDKYRITRATLQMSYTGTWAGASTAAHSCYPIAHVFADEDDSAIPTSFAEVLQRGSLRRLPFTPVRSFFALSVRPRFLLAGTSTIAPVGTWIDMQNPTLIHNCVKMWLQNYNNAIVGPASNMIQLTVRLDFECANTR